MSKLQRHNTSGGFLYTLGENRSEHQFFAYLDLQERRFRASLSPEHIVEYDRFNSGGYANYPVGEQLPCYSCEPRTDVDDDGFPCVLRECVDRGPVVNRADPTQSYALACGHITI